MSGRQQTREVITRIERELRDTATDASRPLPQAVRWRILETVDICETSPIERSKDGPRQSRATWYGLAAAAALILATALLAQLRPGTAPIAASSEMVHVADHSSEPVAPHRLEDPLLAEARQILADSRRAATMVINRVPAPVRQVLQGSAGDGSS